MSVRILIGDARERLRELPDGSVHCVVTSPPYFGLRDYGVDGQMGLEATPEEYVSGMVELFREVRRVLRDDGTLWLNLGDSYTGSGKGGNPESGKQATNKGSQSVGVLYGKTGESAQHAAVTNVTRKNFDLGPKQLLGIPWRVAFALQAPDYLGRIRNESDRAWLAALIDGEGCVSILSTKSGHGSGDSYPPILQVRMCDRECIDKAMALVGSQSDNPAQYPPSMVGQRPAYQWRIHGRKAADTLAEIYPFLLIKRKQAIVAWNHQAVRDSYETKRGAKIPAAALEKQKLCRELIQKLNKREPVDLPSWMVEPPLPIGPGWYLRQDVIWSKPNPMPESVRDRCTKAHEYIFMLSKSPRYYYDAEAIKNPASEAMLQQVRDGYGGADTKDYSAGGAQSASGTKARIIEGARKRANKQRGHGRRHAGFNDRWDQMRREEQLALGSNKRSVWTVATQPFSGAHFATFPPALIEPCILAGVPARCCSRCGAPVQRETERVDQCFDGSEYGKRAVEATGGAVSGGTARSTLGSSNGKATGKRATIGFEPTCSCDAAFVPGTVLDPFGGAGTTGLVAEKLGRDAILIELNPEYADLARDRLRSELCRVESEAPESVREFGPLFGSAAA